LFGVDFGTGSAGDLFEFGSSAVESSEEGSFVSNENEPDCDEVEVVSALSISLIEFSDNDLSGDE